MFVSTDFTVSLDRINFSTTVLYNIILINNFNIKLIIKFTIDFELDIYHRYLRSEITVGIYKTKSILRFFCNSTACYF